MKRPSTKNPSKKSSRERGPQILYVLSDSTGNLARHMLKSFLTQFPERAFVTEYVPFIQTLSALQKALAEAKRERAAICHALVSDEFKRTISQCCEESGIACHDLTGGTTNFLSKISGITPHPNLVAIHRLDEAYHRRIGALEFTLSHDDGLGADTLCDADIVLAGVSRTSKTPTSIYLAQQGFHVANVSLAFEVAPPPELLKMPANKVIGLTISPQQLVMIRTHRETEWKMNRTVYGEPDHVAREIAWARRLFNQHGWRTLDVTDRAIEETAARIAEMFRRESTANKQPAEVE